MPHWTTPAAAALLAALALAGCKDEPPPAAEAPAGQFRLHSIDGKAPQGTATMTLAADGTLSRDGPCNAWGGRNAAKPPAFKLDGFVSTRRACLIEGGEADFQDGLRTAVRISTDRGGLTIEGGTHRLVFARQ